MRRSVNACGARFTVSTKVLVSTKRFPLLSRVILKLGVGIADQGYHAVPHAWLVPVFNHQVASGRETLFPKIGRLQPPAWREMLLHHGVGVSSSTVTFNLG